jgi:hypothetical protein
VTPLHLHDRLRRLPAGDLMVKVGVFALGAAFIALGLALSVLPGPFTIPPILVGLLIWALEFEFAQGWLDRAQAHARETWAAARAHPYRAGLVTGSGIALLVAGLLLALRWNLLERAGDVIS